MDKETAEKINKGIEAKKLLGNPVVQEVFNQITEELIGQIFSNKDDTKRDNFAYMKHGIDLFVVKLRNLVNEGDIANPDNNIASIKK